MALAVWSISILFSCNSVESSTTADNDNSEDKPLVLEERPTTVSVETASESPFYSELVANGKLIALQRSDLRFQTSGNIISVSVTEGQQVSKGQVLAQLDDTEHKMAARQLLLDKQKAELDYEDHLLTLGHRLADTASLDPEIKQVARLRSGLTGIEMAIEKNNFELDKLLLHAPFAGRVANLNIRPYNASSSDIACTLIGTQNLLVEFKILEQELSTIREGRPVQVTPYSLSGKSYAGQISSVNPMVEASGMINIHAKIANDGALMDGMTVRVFARQLLGDMLSVPKEAVLDRQDRKVVFTVVDGVAKWNYVEIAHENSTHYAIESGLEVGDLVIVQGNFNLAHDKKVRVESE